MQSITFDDLNHDKDAQKFLRQCVHPATELTNGQWNKLYAIVKNCNPRQSTYTYAGLDYNVNFRTIGQHTVEGGMSIGDMLRGKHG